MNRRVIVLGSTGSIGRNTLDVLKNLRDEWTVVGLAAGSRGSDLAAQANAFRPEAIALAQNSDQTGLEGALDYAPAIMTGADALRRLVEEVECDCVVSAVVGTGGLAATQCAVERGLRVALANKEALVIAGSVLIPLAEQSGATIIPIDSEHSAVFQALQAGQRRDVRRIWLTASGGPFRTWSEEAMDEITFEDALNHPTWNMGPKITIDSATMMNKALEIVEARWLFDIAPENIEVVVHPESIIHSLVEFRDGSMMAQLGTPDMRTPIQYALTYPDRRPCPSQPLDLLRTGSLNLHPPDPQRFPALRLGYEVAQRGGTAGAVLNAANEAAVALFRDGAIRFRDIARCAERALQEHDFVASPTLVQLMEADGWARQEVTRCMTC